jgi:hypothetical protein
MKYDLLDRLSKDCLEPFFIQEILLVHFSSQKNDHHDIAEPLLKVALNTITLTLYPAPHIYLSEVINIRLDRIVFNPEDPYGPMLNISCHTGHLDFSSIQTKYTFI